MSRDETSKQSKEQDTLHNFNTKKTKPDWFLSGQENLGLLYEKKAVKDHPYFVKVKTQHFIDYSQNYFCSLKNKKCLDIGCGTGETTELLAKHFQIVIGLDYSQTMLRHAYNKIFGSSFVASDAAKIPFKDSSFDAVVVFNMLHHVNSKETLHAIIAESRRVLQKDGVLAIVEINPLNPISRNVINTCEIDEGVFLDGFNKNLFPTTLFSSQCKSLLANGLFKVMSTSFLIFFPQWLKIFQPIEKLLHKIPLGGLYMIIGEKQ